MGVLIGTAGYLTLGCRVNQYETEAISEALEGLGLRPVPFEDVCDVYVINTCAVTEESLRKSRQMVRRAVKRNPGAFVAVCGCASQLEGEAFAALPGVSFVCGSRHKEDVVEAVKAYLAGRRTGDAGAPTVLAVGSPEGPMTALRVTRFDRTRAYVKIEDGCNGKCAYCVIPSVRGPVTLRPEDDILSEIEALASGGCHEVVLTGIETAAYGARLAPLVRRVADVPGIKRIRFGSLEPSFLRRDFADAIAGLPTVCPHFHLSVQNGSDRILHLMRRKYNVAMLEEAVAALRRVRPETELSADVIVGFPGETEADFAETCDFVRRVGFLHLHIFPYSRRPGTEAATMPDQVPEAVKANRLHRLESVAAEERDKRLARAVSRSGPLTILAETAKLSPDGKTVLVTGHSDAFFECLVTAPAEGDPALLHGRFLSFVPRRAENGILLGQAGSPPVVLTL